jgi:hypothetical protein
MVLTTLTVTPIGLAGSGVKEPHDVDGTVVYELTQGSSTILSRVSGATVILYNLHTGERLTNISDSTGYFLFPDVAQGHYQLIAKHDDNSFLQTNMSIYGIFSVDESDVIGIKLFLEKVPKQAEPLYEVNGTIYDEYNVPLENAMVTIKSIDYPGYTVSSALTNETGQYIIKSFRGLYELWATADSFAYYINQSFNLNMTITNHDIVLNSSVSIISGDITFDENPGTVERNAFLYDIANNEYIHSTFSGYIFQIKAYHGKFNLIIDLPGYKPYYYPGIIELSDSQNSFQLPSTPKLQKTNEEKIVTNIRFNNDNWNTPRINTVWTLNHDSEVFGLELVDYGDPITIGCPRFQVDMESSFGGITDGVANGTVETAEVGAFNDWLKERGPYHMYTKGFFEINDTYFAWKKSTFSIASSGFNGPFSSSSAMTITSDLTYDNVPSNEPLDSTFFKVRFKNLRAAETVMFNVPAGYEIGNVDSYDTEKVWVKKSNLCQINGTTTIDIKRIEDPTSVIEAKNEFDEDLELPYVNVVEDIKFNASESLPGSGVIMNYTWNFADGEIGYGMSVMHNYTTPGVYNTTLVVKTTAGETNLAWLEITVDNKNPIVDFIFQNETGVKLPEVDKVSVGKENTPEDGEFLITFNATTTSDTIDGTEEGMIKTYFWRFGDTSGSTGSGEVDFLSYNHPGTYEVTLNVTDWAGNYKLITKELKIEDREPPVPSMITDPANRICHIDKWITLNATISTDNSMPGALWEEIRDNLTFKWDLDRNKDGDDEDDFPDNDVDATGAIVNFTPTRTGPHPIVLMITDQSGNTVNTTGQPPEQWQIDVIGPDLRLAPVREEISKFIEASKDKPEEGQVVKYTVNVTNTNQVTAWDVIVRFFVDGKEKGTKNINRMDQADWEHVTFKWKASGPDDKHNITINVSLVNNNSFEQFWPNNEQTKSHQVVPSTPIDDTCVAAIVIIVIIIIFVMVYFYRRRRAEAEFDKRREKGKGKGKKKGKKESEKKQKSKSKSKSKDED